MTQEKSIKLSKYFDKNVQLVAGVCSKCYLDDDDDVKVVAVNRKFIQQIEFRNQRHEIKTDDYVMTDTCYIKNINDDNCEKLNSRISLPVSLKEYQNAVDCIKIENYSDNEPEETKVHQKCSKYFSLRSEVVKNFRKLCETNNNLIEKDDLQCILYEDESVKKEQNETTKVLNSTSECSQSPLWYPPKSPHNLIEESLYHNPWALLVATIFLNKTQCMYARPYIEEFLKENPTPETVLKRDPIELETYFRNIGLKKRAEQIWRMSHDFIHKDWKNVKELYGIGKYGEDAYKMFCLGNLNVEPTDRFLKIYQAWYRMKERKQLNCSESAIEDETCVCKNDGKLIENVESEEDEKKYQEGYESC